MGTTRDILKRAIEDDGFRRRLVADPRSAIEELGIELPAGVTVRVHENSDSVINLVLPAAAAAAPGPRPLSNEELEQAAGGLRPLLGKQPIMGGDTFGALSQCCNTSSFCRRLF
jgi:hypothetical protein